MILIIYLVFIKEPLLIKVLIFDSVKSEDSQVIVFDIEGNKELRKLSLVSDGTFKVPQAMFVQVLPILGTFERLRRV